MATELEVERNRLAASLKAALIGPALGAMIAGSELEEIAAMAGPEFSALPKSELETVLNIMLNAMLVDSYDKARTPSSREGVSESWISQAYPLKQITIKLQGTRHSSLKGLVAFLPSIRDQIESGSLYNQEHDDDFGYVFKVADISSEPSFFGELPKITITDA